MKCSVSGCNQRSCLASGDDMLCGDHWKEALERVEVEDEKSEMLRLASMARDGDDIREVLRLLIERSFA
jgi:hypothetical protein